MAPDATIEPPIPVLELLRLATSALLLIATTACGRTADSSPAAATVVDSAGIEIVTSTDPAWNAGKEWRVAAEPSIEIGMVEGPNEYLLAQVRGARRLSDGSIVVANAQTAELRVFGADGRYLRTIGRRGEGPGEFGEILWLTTLPGDSLLVYTFPGRRLSVFTPEGEFVRSTSLDRESAGSVPQVFGRFDDGSLAVTTTNFAGLRDEELLRMPQSHLRFSAEGALIDTLAHLPGAETHMEESTTSDGMRIVSMSEPLFGRSSVAGLVGNRAVFGANDAYELQVVTLDGRLQRLIRRGVEPRAVTQGMLEAAREERIAEARTAEDAERIRQSLQDAPHGAFVPYYERVLGDEEGNLWVQEYAVPGETPPGWAVYDPQGRLLGSVQMPADFRPSHIGAHFVLGVIRNELGVERVQMYSLQKAGEE